MRGASSGPPSLPGERCTFERRGWPLEASLSEDAFDAAVSALVMASCEEQLATLPEETDALYKREGRIWAGKAISGGRELELGERGARGPS